MFKTITAAATAATLAMVLGGCAANEAPTTEQPAGLSGTLNGAGASSAGSAQEAWIAAFQTANSGVTVNYDPVGSGAGRESFFAGAVAFAGTDSSLSDEELAMTSPLCVAEAGYFEVPVYVSPIAVFFNVEGVDSLNLSPAVIAGIFKGEITNWNDAAIAALNPGVKLPATAITPQYRSDKSGTNGNFTGYLAANKVAGWVADQTWTNATKSTTPAGTGVASSSGIVSNLKSTAGSIGYVDLKDAKSGALKVAALKNVAGQFVLPSAAAASAFLANQPVAANGLVSINWAKSVPGGYNASLITYAVVNTGKARAKGAAVKSFLQYVLKTCVPANAANLGYVALSGGQATKAQALLNLIK